MSALPQPAAPDFTAARFNMVESQIRPNKVRDVRLLEALGNLPREMFVPPPMAGIAYIDESVQVGPGRYLLEPMVLARLLNEAAIKDDERVLDIAPASGYSTAVLAALAKEVVAVEADPGLITQAVGNLDRLQIKNAQMQLGPLYDGWKPAAPYNVILINGSIEILPESLSAQLAEGGRLLAVMRKEGPAAIAHKGEARLYEKIRGNLSHRSLFDANVKMVPGFEAKKVFSFEVVMPAIPSVDVEKLRDLLKSDTPPLVLDVREPKEHDICKIPGSQLMPMAELQNRHAELPKDRMIVVHCHHGGRSSRATAFLLQQGFENVFNLDGGIHDWSTRIDSSVKTY